MTKKVLGFKDCSGRKDSKAFIEASKVLGIKQVPVVSVEWLEKECKKQIGKSRTPFADKFTFGHLLEAVRLQVVSK